MIRAGSAAELVTRACALAVASFAVFGGHGRWPTLALLVVAVLVWQLARLPDLADGRRLWANPADPGFQGDGWRWTLALLLPNLLLYRGRAPWQPTGAPVTLDMAPLTAAQRQACYREWEAVQAWHREGDPDMIEVGDVVRDKLWGGTYTGTVVRRIGDYLFVQWHGTCVEDEVHCDDVTPAPEVPNPPDNGFRPMVVSR